MYRHKIKPVAQKKTDSSVSEEDMVKTGATEKSKEIPLKSESDDKNEVLNDIVVNSSVKELLEKNLKWSQIIYEQNRKINRKLMLSAIAGWLRLILILAPLVLALLYLSPVAKQLWSQYQSLSGIVTGQNINEDNVKSATSIEGIMKMINLSPEQQKSIQGLIKK